MFHNLKVPRHHENPRRDILFLQKQIYRQNQRLISESATVPDPHFKRYESNYRCCVRKYSRVSTISEVDAAIADARIVLVGDYHTLNQSQRSFMRVLRHLSLPPSRYLVALEAVQAKYQRALDDFMLDKIDDTAFIKKIGFKKHWFFDLWANYKVIFDFLKLNRVRTFAIETARMENKTLKERDQFMAERVVELAHRHPSDKIFLLVGDLHLATQHLPREIARSARAARLNLPIVSLYQNSPEIYWRLSEKDVIDHALVVRLSKNEFCRMHTPPIIAQQSYLNWLYHEGGGFDWSDAKSSFLEIIQQIAKILEIKLPINYDNIDVYTCGDLSFLAILRRKRIFTPRELQTIKRQILHSESYFMARARMVYIANVSIHHAAEEASHYLKTLLTGLEQPRSHQDAFYANILHEGLGFFGSKLINAKRKCPRYTDFAAELAYFKKAGFAAERHLGYQTAHHFVRHAHEAKAGRLMHFNTVAAMPTLLFLSLTHAIGYDLGDQLYYAFMEGRFSRQQIRRLFEDNWEEEGETGKTYLTLLHALKGLKRPVKI